MKRFPTQLQSTQMSIQKPQPRKIEPVQMKDLLKSNVVRAKVQPTKTQQLGATPASVSHYFFVPLDVAQVEGQTTFWTHQLAITSPSEKRTVVVFRTKSFNLTNFPADTFPGVYWVAIQGYAGFRNKTNTSTERVAPYSLKSVSMLVYEGTISYSAQYELMNDIAWEFAPGTELRVKVYQDEEALALTELPTIIPIQLVVKHLNA